MVKNIRVFAIGGAVIAWGGLAFSLALGLLGPDSAGDVIGRFVSSFTIITNALAALAFTAVAADPMRLRHAAPLGAIAVYLFIVALVFFLEFHGALETTGIAAIPDAAIHDIVPLLYIVFWAAFVPKGTLTWRAPFAWLIFPLAYLAFALTRGALTGIYPYPFLDASLLGYGKVAVNGMALMAIYLVVGFVLTLIDCGLGRFSPAAPSAQS